MEIKLIILLLLSSRGTRSRFNDTKLFLIVPEL